MNSKAPLKALAAVLFVGALFVAMRQQTQSEWESAESTSAEALRALRAADAQGSRRRGEGRGRRTTRCTRCGTRPRRATS